MIPYYSPHFGFWDCLSASYIKPGRRLSDFFRELTGKKYILITASCRSALYLAYKAIGKTGIVHTSPLTCKVAVLPILAVGNQVCFHDVKSNDWTLDPEHLEESICQDSIAIQAIHLGGFPCDLPALRDIADERGLCLIEDCAQGFGSLFQGKPVGSWGDVSCFTLTKNVFGLGGGVLATNHRDLFDRATSLQLGFAKESSLKVAARAFNSVLATHRANPVFEGGYARLVKIRQRYLSRSAKNEDYTLAKELKRPPRAYAGSVASRLEKILALQPSRVDSASQLVSLLEPLGFVFQANADSASSYTKLFCRHEKLSSLDTIRRLNDAGVEAMHLEHRHGIHYQPMLVADTQYSAQQPEPRLAVYELFHDQLISLPLLEGMPQKYQLKIRDTLGSIIDAR